MELKEVASYEWYNTSNSQLDKEQIRIEVDENEVNSMPKIMADKMFLRIILINLIKNAFKAIQDRQKGDNKGLITVGARRCDIKEYPWELFVRDNGVGMTREIRENMFEPFYTTNADGTGLGCSIVQSLVKRMKSRITVDSMVGNKTTVSVQFPNTMLTEENYEEIK